jgi:tetratricopeptide (TPR) repeat protein
MKSFALKSSVLNKAIAIAVTLPVLSILPTHPVSAEDLTHTQRLVNTRQCISCDLSRAGLTYANLSGHDISLANLVQANLSQANLIGANLSGANLTGAVLVNADLTGANLTGANLTGADLRGATLTGVNITGATLEQTNLLGAIGMPPVLTTPENLYVWGLGEAQRGNDRGALNQYSQAIALKADFADAYLARGMTRYRLGDRPGALADAQQAEQHYQAQGNQRGQDVSQQFTQGLEAMTAHEAEEEKKANGGGGGGFLRFLGSVAVMMLRFGGLPF